jgi:hypothetical protein
MFLNFLHFLITTTHTGIAELETPTFTNNALEAWRWNEPMIRTPFHCKRARLYYFQFIDWTTKEVPRAASSTVTLLTYAFVM